MCSLGLNALLVGLRFNTSCTSFREHDRTAPHAMIFTTSSMTGGFSLGNDNGGFAVVTSFVTQPVMQTVHVSITARGVRRRRLRCGYVLSYLDNYQRGTTSDSHGMTVVDANTKYDGAREKVCSPDRAEQWEVRLTRPHNITNLFHVDYDNFGISDGMMPYLWSLRSARQHDKPSIGIDLSSSRTSTDDTLTSHGLCSRALTP